MCCLERDLSLLNLPTKEQQWAQGAKKSGKRSRRVEAAAEQYIKRWFVKEIEDLTTRRALEVKSAQHLETPLGPRPVGGRDAGLKEA